jgi:hypothetical protein
MPTITAGKDLGSEARRLARMPRPYKRRPLALAMANSRPHAALLAAELPPPLPRFLDAHVVLLK